MEKPNFVSDEQNQGEELPIKSAEQLEGDEPADETEEFVAEAPAAKTAKKLAEERKAAGLRGQLKRLTSLAAFGAAALVGGERSAEAGNVDSGSAARSEVREEKDQSSQEVEQEAAKIENASVGKKKPKVWIREGSWQAHFEQDMGIVAKGMGILELGEAKSGPAKDEDGKERFGLYFGGKHYADVVSESGGFDGEAAFENAIVKSLSDLTTMEFDGRLALDRMEEWGVEMTEQGISLKGLLLRKNIDFGEDAKHIRFEGVEIPRENALTVIGDLLRRKRTNDGLNVYITRTDGSGETIRIKEGKLMSRKTFPAPSEDSAKEVAQN